MKYCFVLLSLFVTSIPAYCEQVAYAGLMKKEGYLSGLAEIGLRGDLSEDYYVSASLMWLEHKNKVYDAANVSLGLDFGTDLKLYAGAGLFAGKYEKCEKDLSDEVCESSLTGGVYPELALQLSISKLRVAVYTRYYRTFDSGSNEYNMIGIYLGYEM